MSFARNYRSTTHAFNMTIARSTLISICPMVLLCVRLASAQLPDSVGVRLEPIPATGVGSTLDHSLRFNSSCVVSTPLIRLRDVASPIGPPSPWWERAGSVVIGMMPIDGSDMVIERERLTQVIDRDASIPPIDWVGPQTVRVRLVAQKIKTTAAPGINPSIALTAATASHTDVARYTGAGNGQDVTAMPEATVSAKVPIAADLPALSPQDSDRLIRLIHFAIDRADLSLRDAYDIEIDPAQLALRALAEVRRVDRIEFLNEPTEGVISATVFGITSRQEINQTIDVGFRIRPMIVIPRESLRRGHIITHADLTLVPAPRGIPIASAITKIDDAVDMQVVNVLQKDRPIAHSSITRPILIERGDLVEVQVVGGGVTVATSARSLSKGAAGDLIAVETLEPRKKIIARVARSGLVEIFTRPPRVR